jgi:hypothetical protein
MAILLSPDTDCVGPGRRHVKVLAGKTMISLCANIMDKGFAYRNTPEQSFLPVIGAIIDVRVQVSRRATLKRAEGFRTDTACP